MDVEAALVAWLGRRGFAAYGDAPKQDGKPSKFVTVERVGGRAGASGIDRATVAIQCWAPTRAEAAKLAYEVSGAVEAFADEAQECSASQNSLYSFPTAKKEPRYQIVYDIAGYIE